MLSLQFILLIRFRAIVCPDIALSNMQPKHVTFEFHLWVLFDLSIFVGDV